jgi:hypothetical protein
LHYVARAGSSVPLPYIYFSTAALASCVALYFDSDRAGSKGCASELLSDAWFLAARLWSCSVSGPPVRLHLVLYLCIKALLLLIFVTAGCHRYSPLRSDAFAASQGCTRHHVCLSWLSLCAYYLLQWWYRSYIKLLSPVLIPFLSQSRRLAYMHRQRTYDLLANVQLVMCAFRLLRFG